MTAITGTVCQGSSSGPERATEHVTDILEGSFVEVLGYPAEVLVSITLTASWLEMPDYSLCPEGSSNGFTRG